ncbi:hypothetical protein WJX72_000528 [[Myrmecia] bisecta]|uniref:AB hydrolase-1 domain-containing protein n=1 Tax=[Myrmecia] bisecta TaxID=41462 RepID=A0AAW1PKM0_9CHLO
MPSQGTGGSDPQGAKPRAMTLKEVASSFVARATVLAICLPFWAMASLTTLVRFLQSPRTFFKYKSLEPAPKDPLPGLKHRFVEANGIRFHTVSTGKVVSNQLMLCVHGFPSMWAEWRNQMAAFRDDYEVVAFDMRGYGDTDKPKGVRNYAIDHLVDDIGSLIPALGYDKCVLVAHDWGAVAAWGVAYYYTNRIERLVVMAVPHPVSMNENLDLEQWAKFWYMFMFQAPLLPELFLTNNEGEQFDAIFKKLPPGCTPRIPQEEIDRLKRAFAQPGAATAAVNYYRALFANMFWIPKWKQQRRVTRRNGVLKVPTLCLYGDRDIAMGTKLLRGMDKYVEDVQVHVFKDCSHWIPEERPEEVNQLMRDFLAGKRIAGSLH